MEIYNNRNSGTNSNSRPKRTCSYCSDPDHVVTDCPNAVYDWAYFQRYEIPLKDNPNKHWTKGARRCWGHTGVAYDHWYRNPSEWGKWFVDCEKAIKKIEKAKAKAQSKKKGNAKSAKSCGFCGGTGHNRRDCQDMQSFKERLLQANRVWRQRIYDRLVADMGISVGSAVKVKKTHWNKESEESIGLVTDINWDELSMFCLANVGTNRWDDSLRQEFRQRLNVTVSVDGQKIKLGFKNKGKDGIADTFGDLVHCTGYTSYYYEETIARSETPLDQEWVDQGHENAMDFLIKKYSLEKLKGWNVLKLLDFVEKANKLKKLSQNT